MFRLTPTRRRDHQIASQHGNGKTVAELAEQYDETEHEILAAIKRAKETHIRLRDVQTDLTIAAYPDYTAPTQEWRPNRALQASLDRAAQAHRRRR